MALSCAAPAVELDFTEFIDCSTLTINYDELGRATINFTVISTAAEPVDATAYNNLTFGGVSFEGFVTSLEIRKVTGTVIYEHKYTVLAIGCKEGA